MNVQKCREGLRSTFEIKKGTKSIVNRDACLVKADEEFSHKKDDNLLFNQFSECLKRFKTDYVNEYGSNIDEIYNSQIKFAS